MKLLKFIRSRPPKTLGLIFMTLCMLFTVSCLSPSTPSKGEVHQISSTSQFMIHEITGHSDIETIHTNWQMPLSRTFTFRACFVDTVTRTPLALYLFEVLKNEKKEETAQGENSKGKVKKVIFSGTTDSFGCLIWKETYPYLFTQSAAYLTFERTFQGASLYSKGETVSLAVNPWVKDRNIKEEEVRDLRFKPLGQSFQVFDLESQKHMDSSNEQKGRLFIPEIHIENLRSFIHNRQQHLSMDLVLHPQLKTQNHLQQATYHPLRKGSFTIYAYLFSSSPYESTLKNPRLLALQKEKAALLEGGILRVNLKTKLLQKCQNQEGLHLFLKVIPQKGGGGLNDFNGFYAFSQTKCSVEVPFQFKGSLQASVISEGEGSTSEEVPTPETTPTSKMSASEVPTSEVSAHDTRPAFSQKPLPLHEQLYQQALQLIDKDKGNSKTHNKTNPQSYLDFFEDEFITAQTPIVKQKYPYCDTNIYRTVNLRPALRIRESFTGRPMAQQVFRIYQIDEDSQGGTSQKSLGVFKSDRDGRLKWHFLLSHHYYERPKYLHKKFILEWNSTAPETPENPGEITKASQTVILGINPWSQQRWVIVADMANKNLETEKTALDDLKRLKNEIAINNIRKFNIGYDYKIDSYMNLIIVKKLLLTFSPFVKILSDITSGIEEPLRPLRSGQYVVETAIYNRSITFRQQALEMLDSSTKVATLNGDMLKAEFSYDISDPRFMRSRSLLFVEVNPVNPLPITEKMDKNCQLKKDVPIEKYKNKDLISPTFVAPIFLSINKEDLTLTPINKMKLDSLYASDIKPGESRKPEESEESEESNSKAENLISSKWPAGHPELETNYKAIMGSFLKDWKNTGRSASIADLKKWKEEELLPKYREKMDKNAHPSSFAKFFQLPYINLKKPWENSSEAHPKILAMAESFMENSQDPASLLTPALCEYILSTQKQFILDSLPATPFARRWPVPVYDYANSRIKKLFTHFSYLFQNVCTQMKNRDLSIITNYRVYKTEQVKWTGNYSMQMAQQWGQGKGTSYAATKDLCIKADIGLKPSLWEKISFLTIGASAGNSVCQRSNAVERKDKYSRNSSTISLFQSQVSFTATRYQKCQHIYIKTPSDIPNWKKSIVKRKMIVYDTLENWPGLFICSGDIETAPLQLDEKFGYIHQLFTGLSDMADTGELKNHPWVIPLRSKQDIHYFVRLMKDFAEVKEGISISDLDLFSLKAIRNVKMAAFEEHGRLHKMSDELSNYSNEQNVLNYLKKAYREKRTHAYPGFYALPISQEQEQESDSDSDREKSPSTPRKIKR